MDRDEAIRRIREGLKARSGKSWSVKGGRGTGYGWLRIDAPPARRRFEWDGTTPVAEGREGYASKADREELAKLLGLETIHAQGESVPASSDYRVEYVDRAEGRPPSKIGRPYWD